MIKKILLFLISPLVRLILSSCLVGLKTKGDKPLRFYPYTFVFFNIFFRAFSVGLGWSRPLDPINAIFVGWKPKELRELITKKGWATASGSGQYVLVLSKVKDISFQCEWLPPKPKYPDERFHIRFFDAGTINGNPTVLAAAHQEYHDEDLDNHIIISWNNARNRLVSGLREFRQKKTGIITGINWRGRPNDGRAVMVYKN